jgi:phosphatidylglycerol---prolipoprotein diacylglyceryl transferase
MKGIIININPVALQVGAFEVRWYSLAIMAAVIAAIVMAVYRGKKRGIEPTDIYTLAPWVLVGGIFGARLFHVIDAWEYYSQHPSQIIMISQGGLAIWGGLAGGVLAVAIYTWKRRIPFGIMFDTLVSGLLLAQVIGRFGCIVNGDAHGRPTNLPWGFIYTNPGAMIPSDLLGVPTHPYPVYEMLLNVVALALILRFQSRFKKPGLIFLGYLSYYSLVRFFLTFVREEKVIFLGLQQAQLVSIAGIIITMLLLILLVRKSNTPVMNRQLEQGN